MGGPDSQGRMGGDGVEGGGAEEVSCSRTDWLDSLWRFGLGLSSLLSLSSPYACSGWQWYEPPEAPGAGMRCEPFTEENL